MKLHELFINAITILALAACSSGSSGKGKNSFGNYNYDFTASEKVIGHFIPDQYLSQHLPEAEKELAEWKDECNKASGLSLESNLKVGLRVIGRGDQVSLWPKLESARDVRIYDRSVEKIISPNKFISVGDEIAQDYSVKFRDLNITGDNGFSSELLEIISTRPSQLKKQIENEIASNASDDNYVRCNHDYPNDNKDKKATTFASLVLKDGTKVKGILVTEYNEYTNYTCALYRKDNSMIREIKLADRVAEERINFYSKELINPFESRCHDSPGLLSVETVKDISGNRGIITLEKYEVLSISK